MCNNETTNTEKELPSVETLKKKKKKSDLIFFRFFQKNLSVQNFQIYPEKKLDLRIFVGRIKPSGRDLCISADADLFPFTSLAIFANNRLQNWLAWTIGFDYCLTNPSFS